MPHFSPSTRWLLSISLTPLTNSSSVWLMGPALPNRTSVASSKTVNLPMHICKQIDQSIWEIIIMTELRESAYRYVNLFLFILAGCCNSVAPQAFVAIAPTTSKLYGVSELEVNANSMLYSFMFPFVIFPSNYIIEKYGLKVGSLMGEMFLILGLLIRLLFNYHFYFMLIGTFITGLGFTFMINSPNKFAVTWFPVRQIPLVNSICIFSIFTSDSIGAFASGIFLDEHSTKQDYWHFFAVESGVIIVILLLMAFFFRGEPEYPPNYSSAMVRDSYSKSFKLLIRNSNYRILFLSMSCVFTVLNIFFATLSWIFKPYGLGGIENGIVLIVANISGCLGCVIMSSLFGSKNYRRNCTIYAIASAASLLVIWLGAEMDRHWVIYLGAGLIGFMIFPYLTTLTQFASNTAFPVGQSLSGGTILFGGQIVGVIGATICSLYIFDGKSFTKTRVGVGMLITLMILGGIIVQMSKQKLRRSEYEEKEALISHSKHQQYLIDSGPQMY